MNKEENNKYYPDELTTEILDELWFDMSFTKDYIKHKYEFYKLRDSYVLLQQENIELKNNWNKLKNIAKSQSDLKQKLFNDRLYFEVDEILEIMEGIEKGKDNE